MRKTALASALGGLGLLGLLNAPAAQASSHGRHHRGTAHAHHHVWRWHSSNSLVHWGRPHRWHHVIQCVAYVHQATSFQIHGNARDWWPRAAGRYERGQTPEPGAVLAFRPTARIPLGHVAVVRSQLDDRTILIDQAHWASPGIAHNVRVVDVSPNNDWTAVRVALNGNSARLGSVYPTHGFIYERFATGSTAAPYTPAAHQTAMPISTTNTALVNPYKARRQNIAAYWRARAAYLDTLRSGKHGHDRTPVRYHPTANTAWHSNAAQTDNSLVDDSNTLDP
ncbi:CHAP domain-containing protein [Formicincola oecophyllae]|uniref:CHAP domain-containing protein n=1 Tax=Formicincola oecophyllae TaxID=2558361 RepID=A0A4Y6U7Z9_9PROT|nr:CHAP domain-containing protein [Formicincola oecophyllae]QDH13472.1 CHAP domain-containing protein [Formicincola oecophyllae]